MSDAQTGRGRRIFLITAALFFGPVIGAYLLYFVFPQWQPEGRTNYGQLINPARPLPPLKMRDAKGQSVGTPVLYSKWTLLYLGSEQCDKACVDKLFEMRQVRTLLGQDRERLQRVYAAPSAAALDAARAQLKDEIHPDLIYLNVEDSGLREFIAPTEAGAVYLLDPHANWLMVYPAQDDYKGVLKDLKKLFRLSQIG